MATWKIAVGVCGPEILYETCSGKTKEEAVKKLIDKQRALERETWEFDQELAKMRAGVTGEEVNEEFVPKPESFWTEKYEDYVKHAHEVVRKKK